MPEPPSSEPASLVKEHGIWVFTGDDTTIDILELIHEHRELRMRHLMGLGEDVVRQDVITKEAKRLD